MAGSLELFRFATVLFMPAGSGKSFIALEFLKYLAQNPGCIHNLVESKTKDSKYMYCSISGKSSFVDLKLTNPAEIRQPTMKFLIVVPNILAQQWENKIGLYFGPLAKDLVVCIKTTKELKAGRLDATKETQCIFVVAECVEKKLRSKEYFDVVIFDEIQITEDLISRRLPFFTLLLTCNAWSPRFFPLSEFSSLFLGDKQTFVRTIQEDELAYNMKLSNLFEHDYTFAYSTFEKLEDYPLDSITRRIDVALADPSYQTFLNIKIKKLERMLSVREHKELAEKLENWKIKLEEKKCVVCLACFPESQAIRPICCNCFYCHQCFKKQLLSSQYKCGICRTSLSGTLRLFMVAASRNIGMDLLSIFATTLTSFPESFKKIFVLVHLSKNMQANFLTKINLVERLASLLPVENIAGKQPNIEAFRKNHARYLFVSSFWQIDFGFDFDFLDAVLIVSDSKEVADKMRGRVKRHGDRLEPISMFNFLIPTLDEINSGLIFFS